MMGRSYGDVWSPGAMLGKVVNFWPVVYRSVTFVTTLRRGAKPCAELSEFHSRRRPIDTVVIGVKTIHFVLGATVTTEVWKLYANTVAHLRRNGLHDIHEFLEEEL